ncbi:MAG TPA: hypothetical protein VH134_06190 [Candidatus Dormibacteraeota bacterium]|nr:hypothetical protein [Candidatus Dormibacteraeota bacterium]
MLRPDERHVSELLRSIWTGLDAGTGPGPVDDPRELADEIARLRGQVETLDDELDRGADDRRWDGDGGDEARAEMRMLSETMLKLDERRRWTLARIGELEGRPRRRRTGLA